MPQTPNHGYNVPNEGEKNWDEPLNENFRQYDTDIEIRDSGANLGDYDPKDGAKFITTDSGQVYLGNGSDWLPIETTGPVPTYDGLNIAGDNLGVGTHQPSVPLDVAGQNNWNLDNGDGDLRVGNDDYRLAMGVALGGAGAGACNIRAKGGINKLHLGAGDSRTLSIDGDNQSVGIGTTSPNRDLDVAGTATTTRLETTNLDVSGRTSVSGSLVVGYPGAVEIEHDSKVVFQGPDHEYVLDNKHISHSLDELYLECTTTGNALSFDSDGNLRVDGSISASSKNFVHPVDTNDGEKEVVYTATEAGTPHTEASGVTELEDGRAAVDLPQHFAWVTDGDEPIHVQTTPYSGESGGLAVVERSTDRLVVEDLDGEGDYEFAYIVKGTRDGHADKQVVREPSASRDAGDAPAPADD